MSDQSKDALEAKALVEKMSRAEKIKYYLGYYKIHIIVALIVVIALICFIRDKMNQKDYLMYFGLINGPSIETEDFVAAMEDYLDAGDKESVQVYTSLQYGENSTDSYNMLMIYCSAKTMDVGFCDESALDALAYEDALIPVDNWMSDDLKTIWSDKTVEKAVGITDYETGAVTEETHALAIDMAGSKLMDELGLDERNHYLVVFASVQNMDYVEKFCQYVYDLEKAK